VTNQLVYIYAIAAAQSDSTVHGIGGTPIRWIADEGLHAAVSDVPAEEFGEQQLNAGLSDMQWLGPRAVAHQEVNQRLHESSEAIIPLAFGTVFRDDARVKGLLRNQVASLTERLARVRGCSEWVVTVHPTEAPDVGGSEPVQHLRQEMAAAGPGRAHLLRKRLADVERDAARLLELQASEDVLTVLRGTAHDVFVEPLPTDVVERPLLRASVLVRRPDEERLVKVVEGLQSEWLSVVLTGPWPPYRFGGLEHAAATR
jgi:hypothetical protein